MTSDEAASCGSDLDLHMGASRFGARMKRGSSWDLVSDALDVSLVRSTFSLVRGSKFGAERTGTGILRWSGVERVRVGRSRARAETASRLCDQVLVTIAIAKLLSALLGLF